MYDMRQWYKLCEFSLFLFVVNQANETLQNKMSEINQAHLFDS